MSERVSLAALAVLGLCILAAGWFAHSGSENTGAMEIVKLVVAGLVGFMTGEKLAEVRGASAYLPPPDHGPRCSCNDYGAEGD